jgi:hypothetical protein
MLFTILSAGDGYTSMIVAGIAGLDRHLPGQDTSGSSSRISMYMNYSRVFERVLIRSPRGVEVVVKDLFCFRVQQLGVALDRASRLENNSTHLDRSSSYPRSSSTIDRST